MFVRILLLAIACLLGCSGPQLVYLPDMVQPPPAADLPVELRLKNWIGTDVDGVSGGSCVHATTRMVFRTAGEYELDQEWYQAKYEGPETANRLLDKLHSLGVVFAATEDGDERLLEDASAAGRWATIFYYPSHSIAFCGFDYVDGRESAILLDNNFPDAYIIVEKQLFLDSWKHAYRGFAVVPWLTQSVPRTFPRSYER
jgi:hypothetical protein